MEMPPKTYSQNLKELLAANDLPHFTVIIPSYNRQERLARALLQLNKQRYPMERLEVIVVLDGCQDNSAQRVEELRPQLKYKLKVVSRSQGGPAAARNTGVLAASSEYILFLDDDVMATPDLILQHWAQHSQDAEAIVVGTMSTPTDHRRPVWIGWEEYILEKQYREIVDGLYPFTSRAFYTGNCSMRRNWVIEAGMFDENFKRYEDVELGCRMEALGAHFYFNPQAIGYHYAYRSFKSWLKAHYYYGVYAVKLGHEKKVAWILPATYVEFSERHWLTQQASNRLLNHQFLQQVVARVLLGLAWIATLVRQERRGYQMLSGVANIFFWQGFNDELKASKVTSMGVPLTQQNVGV